MLGRSLLRAVPSKAFARQSFRQTTTRASSTSSSSSGAHAESPFYLNAAGIAATAVAAAFGGWYFYLYGPEGHAMTPAEEG
ncbi:cytochrome c1 [Ascosphaera atra]|nr:cytochrome c1 [Ascosphaera atra]